MTCVINCSNTNHSCKAFPVKSRQLRRISQYLQQLELMNMIVRVGARCINLHQEIPSHLTILTTAGVDDHVRVGV